MDLENLVAVSGMPGVYKILTTRNNGLVVEDLDTGKRKFAPSRKHQFTPLESVGIYTDTDATELKIVFEKIKETGEPVSAKAPNEELTKYFAEILPDFDRDRVMASDMKKVIKWYLFLNERGLLEKTSDSSEEE